MSETGSISSSNDSFDELPPLADIEEDEVDIVYEGQSSNVARAERISFVKVKTEADSVVQADESLAFPDTTRRARLPPLSSPATPLHLAPGLPQQRGGERHGQPPQLPSARQDSGHTQRHKAGQAALQSRGIQKV